MNRIDRLYALVEELRAAGSRGRTARRLADHFEVSVRTIERDLSALGQAGVPLATKQGRAGGYALDRSMSLPPLNFTPGEAAAVAVALGRNEHVLSRATPAARCRRSWPPCPSEPWRRHARPRGRSDCWSSRLPTPTPRSRRPSGGRCATTARYGSGTPTSAACRPNARSSPSTSWS